MNRQNQKQLTPRLIPFFTVVAVVLFSLKAANIWVGVSEVSAGRFFQPRSAPSLASAETSVQAPTLVPLDETQLPDDGNSIVNETQITRVTSFKPQDNRLLEHLGARRSELDRRETALKVREDLLKTAEIRLEERFATLDARRTELRSLEAERARLNTQRVEGLVSAYERMKPRDAAEIFELLENDLLILVAGQMRTQALAGILAEMSPTRAHALTRLISEDGAIAKDAIEGERHEQG